MDQVGAAAFPIKSAFLGEDLADRVKAMNQEKLSIEGKLFAELKNHEN